MPKYWKEVVAGFVPVMLIFMAFVGINIFPVIIALGMVAALLFIAHARGGLTVNAGADKKRKKNGPSKLTLKRSADRTMPSRSCVKRWTS